MLQEGRTAASTPVLICKKKINLMERNWSVWDKEAVAVKLALITCHHLLEGTLTPFEIWTDHKNLEALQTPR